MLEPYLARWHLTPNGRAIRTRGSSLLPVRAGDRTAILKLALEEDEQRGGDLMAWWDGAGAARILAHDAKAILMERLLDTPSLSEMARGGRDEEATRILCRTAKVLHTARSGSRPTLLPLEAWFDALHAAASQHGGLLGTARNIAHALLQDPRDIVVLHGDIHHGNILYSEERGWLAIDPKALLGERGFDFANLFANPDADCAAAPGRLASRVEIVAEEAGLDRIRLLQWIVAFNGLSAAWMIQDGEDPSPRMRIVEASAGLLSVV